MVDTHAHSHAVGDVGIDDRHAHERDTYDAMAVSMLADMSDEELRVHSDRIPFYNREHVDYLSFAMAEVTPLAGKRILEVGVGGGTLATWLALQGADVTGIDVSGGILEVAAKRAALSGVAERTRFEHCPIEEFDDPPASFDAVVGNNVVHHFERDLAMANLARLLRPEGRAVFCEPVLFLPEIARRARYSSLVSRRFPPHTHTPHQRSLNRGDLEIMVRQFGSVVWSPFQLLCRLQNFFELSDPMWNRLHAIDRFTLDRVASARWLARMIVITLDEPKPIHSRNEEKVQK